MRLTKRQRLLLGIMMVEDDCVEENGAVFIGEERTNIATLMFFIRNCLIEGPDELGGTRRYSLNEWGIRALQEPDFDPQAELRLAVKKAREAKDV